MISCDILLKYGESRYGASKKYFVKLIFFQRHKKGFRDNFFQTAIDFRILFSSEQAGKPTVPKLQPPHVGPWFPPPTPWEGSPPPTFLPTWPSSPPPSLLVPSQPPPSLPGKPACSPPQPSKSSTSRYGQRFLVADQLFGNLFHKYKCKDEHLNSVIYYFATLNEIETEQKWNI